MIKWIRENAALASIAASVVLAISTGAVAYHQLSNLIEKQSSVDSHIHDTTRHIDPMRDGMSQKHLVERLERLEERVERQERRGRGRRRTR